MKDFSTLINAGIPKAVVEEIAKKMIDNDRYKINILAHDKDPWKTDENTINHCLYLDEKPVARNGSGFLYVVDWLESGIKSKRTEDIEVKKIHSYDLLRLQELIS